MEIIKPAERGISQQDKAIFRNNVREALEQFPNELGYVAMVAIGLDGQFSRTTILSRDCFFGETLAPSLVAEILRRDVAATVSNEVITGKV